MHEGSQTQRTTFAKMSTPAKALATCIIITLAFGMVGALGQIYIHDIIPTFFSDPGNGDSEMSAGHHGDKMSNSDQATMPAAGRGDLFSDLAQKKAEPKEVPLYRNAQFVWTLKWSHIHLFGMNMIFILMGAITLPLNISTKARTWLVVLPFVGVLLDIFAMWLKGFVSPVFFWLHLPGGGLFGAVFAYVSLRALWEMWGKPRAVSPAH